MTETNTNSFPFEDYTSFPMNAVQAADAYLKKGVKITPCDYKSKIPIYDTLFKDRTAWRSDRGKWTFSKGVSPEEVPLYFFGNGYNIAICNGKSSNGLVNVDLDLPEPLAVARYILPPTLKSGREGKELAHYWYLIEGPIPANRWFKLPEGRPGFPMLVELLSTGSETLAPPSIYPEGERCVWGGDKIFRTSRSKLVKYVDDVAVAALLLRHYPDAVGTRLEMAMSAASYLSSRLAPQRVKRIIDATVQASEDQEWSLTPFLVKDLEAVVEKIVTGKRVKGVRPLEGIAPTVAEILLRWFQWDEQRTAILPWRRRRQRGQRQRRRRQRSKNRREPKYLISSLEMGLGNTKGCG
jgi:hypothetical protein